MDALSLDLPPPFLLSESPAADKLLTLTVSVAKGCFEFLLSNWRLCRGGASRRLDSGAGDEMCGAEPGHPPSSTASVQTQRR